MEATAARKEEFVDPVCGMTVDPATAAGVSERDGVRYYFCSAGCKAKFDSGMQAAPVKLSPRRRAAAAGDDAAPRHDAAAHAHHEASTPRAEGREARDASDEEAPAKSYRTMMRKFWFATAVGLPLLLLMFAEFVPSLREALMPTTA